MEWAPFFLHLSWITVSLQFLRVDQNLYTEILHVTICAGIGQKSQGKSESEMASVDQNKHGDPTYSCHFQNLYLQTQVYE